MPAQMERAEQRAGRIRRAMTQLQRRLRLEGSGDGLPPAKLSVLGLLRRAGAPMTPGELAAADGVQPQSMTRVLAELEEAGLVTRARDRSDARQFRIALAGAGETALDADLHERDAWLAHAMVLELSPVERTVLAAAADLMERVSGVDRALVDRATADRNRDAPALPSAAIPVLPMYDAARTVAFFTRIGFMNSPGSDDRYVMLERGMIELHFALNADVDPLATAGVARISVPDADAFRAEVIAAGVSERKRSDDLHSRWARTHDLSGVGRISDKPYRVREFALFDPTNNLFLVGHPLGINRRRTARRAG
jgi:DNA-binding MarR family transcriptional regulator